MGTFIFDAARDVANSPSGCASLCIADGLKPHGKAACNAHQPLLLYIPWYKSTLYPNITAEVSIADTFRSTLGRITYRLNDSSFSRNLAATCKLRE